MSNPLTLAARGLPVWAMLPVVLGQGLRVRRTTARLPAADGATGRVGSGPRRLRVAVVGDSLAAGVGVNHHRDTVAGQLAARLAWRYDATVDWVVHACTGHTAGEANDLLRSVELASADVVVVSVGVNDAKNLHTLARWRRELAALLDHVLREAPHARVLLLALPPLEAFPSLPAPLSVILGARALRLEAVAAEVVAGRPRVRRVDLDLAEEPAGAFASDGFHPGPPIHRRLAEAAADLLADLVPVSPSGPAGSRAS